MTTPRMPDPPATGSSTPVSPLDAAQVLEDAADLLLIRGVCRDGTYGRPGGSRCAMGAMEEAGDNGTALLALSDWLRRTGRGWRIGAWNDHWATTDDEVRDTLLLVAKDLRGQAVPS